MPNRLSRLLQARIDRLIPELRRLVQKALDRLSGRISVDKLAQALERGDELTIRAITSRLPSDLAPAVSTVRRAFGMGAQSASASIAYTFNRADPLAASAASRFGAALITGISDETRRAIRATVAEAFKAGISSRDVAKIIKPLLGLTGRQAKAVLTRRSATVNAGWDAARVAADADRYAAKLLRQRAELIARTELAKASTAGQIEAWRQARAAGQLDPSLVKTWIVTPDDRLCPFCAPLENVQAPLDGTFTSGQYTVLGPPLHPQCRCAIGLKQARQARRRAA